MNTINACRLAGFFFLLTFLTSCAIVLPQSTQLKRLPPKDLPEKVELSTTPFFVQEKYHCGPATLAMVLNTYGKEVTPEQIVEDVYIPSLKGSLQVEMLATVRRRGMLAYELSPDLTSVLKEVAAGNPVIVLENYSFGLYPIWHYSVVVGYDLKNGEITRRSGKHYREIMPFSAFEYIWKSDGYWSMIALPLEKIPASATEQEYAKAILALEKTGQINNAKIAYSTLLNKWPESLVGLMGLGNTSYALKDLEGARSAFTKAIQLHPNSAEGYNNLAVVLTDLGNLDDALIAAEKAVEIGGSMRDLCIKTLQEIERKKLNK